MPSIDRLGDTMQDTDRPIRFMPGVQLLIACLTVTLAFGQDNHGDQAQTTNAAMHKALEQGDYDRAVELGHRLVDLAPDAVTPPYNLACAYARKGDADAAVRWLHTAGERGFSFLATFQRDTDLDLIRSHPGFAEAAALIEKNSDRELEAFKKKVENAKVLTFLPPRLDAGKPVPLIVALHGYGSDAADIASLWRPLAAEVGAILIAPQAVTPAGRGFNWGVIEQAQYLILNAIEDARSKHNIDPKRIVLTGFSQGGGMSFTVGLRHPEMFAGVIPMAAFYDHGLTPIPAKATSDLPRFFIMNGALDEEADNNRDAARRLEAIGAPVELRIYEGVGHALPRNRQEEIREALRFVLAD